jgi:hypothetical protein
LSGAADGFPSGAFAGGGAIGTAACGGATTMTLFAGTAGAAFGAAGVGAAPGCAAKVAGAAGGAVRATMRLSRLGTGGWVFAAGAAPRTLCCTGATGAAAATGALAAAGGACTADLATDWECTNAVAATATIAPSTSRLTYGLGAFTLL